VRWKRCRSAKARAVRVMTPLLLTAKNIRKSFGPAVALDGVDIDVEGGKCLPAR
jgi:ABC-type sugar transport system ATPase subunit